MDILAITDSNALAGRHRDLYTIASPIRPGALSVLPAPLPARALSVIADIVTHRALLLSALSVPGDNLLADGLCRWYIRTKALPSRIQREIHPVGPGRYA